VNQSKKQHQLAVNLLKELGLDYLRLEPQRGNHYRYHAWNVPLISGNGYPGRMRALVPTKARGPDAP
jgi:hypothetical protein